MNQTQAAFRMNLLLVIFATLVAVNKTNADVVTDQIEYLDGDTVLEGHFAVPKNNTTDSLPGILLIHGWTGLQEYARDRARQLAELGYVVFAADIYGKGIRPTNPRECAVQAKVYRGDRTLFRRRLNLALDVLKSHRSVDDKRLGAIGYCFGGTGVIELLRSGADVAGVVSFHGGLDSPRPEDGKNIKGKLLICHGADDPHVHKEDIDALITEMNQWKVDWQMISYGGAVHSFTQADAGNDPSDGRAYNEAADRRSWEHMKSFFNEVFGR